MHPSTPFKQYTTYAIRNTVSGALYIGGSQSVSNRKRQHFTELRAGRHPCMQLQADWNEDPLPWDFIILEQGDHSTEEDWILWYSARGYTLYNTDYTGRPGRPATGRTTRTFTVRLSEADHAEVLRRAAKMGFPPNRWLGFVIKREIVRRPGEAERKRQRKGD